MEAFLLAHGLHSAEHSFAYPGADNSFGVLSDKELPPREVYSRTTGAARIYNAILTTMFSIVRGAGQRYNPSSDQCQTNPTIVDAFVVDKRTSFPEYEKIIDDAIARKKWVVLVFHKLSLASDDVDPSVYKDVTSLIASRKERGEVWVDTVFKIGSYARNILVKGVCVNAIPPERIDGN